MPECFVSGDAPAGTVAAVIVAAEADLAGRAKDAAFVVCPAAWRSKVALLEKAGYRTALTWMIRR